MDLDPHSMESSDGTEQPSFVSAEEMPAPEASGSGTHDDLTVHLGADDPFDWEAYIANYQGSTKIPRLIHIAKTAPELRAATAQEAMRLIQETTNDTATYNSALMLRNTNANGQRLSDDQTVAAEQDWIREASKRSKVEGEKLDLELRNYQNNLIKESIRMANRDLADHHRRTGSLTEALKCYQRTRDFCSTSEHVVEMCLNVIEISLELHNYSNVSTFVSKAEGVLESYNPSAAVGSSSRTAAGSGSSVVPPSKGASTSGGDAIGALFRAGGSTTETSSRGGVASAAGGDAVQARLKKEVAQIQAKLKIADGLAALGLGRYETAARSFADADPQQAEGYNHIMSAGDVALYAVLCGLAVYPRPALKSQIIDRPNLRGFMEHEPHTKELLDAFWNCEYKKGLGLLAKWKSRHVLDVYLHPHIPRLTRLIIQRSLSQFFSPFSSVSFSRLGSAFGWSSARTEEEVLGLVERGEIDAKLDWVDKVIVANTVDERQALFMKTLQTGSRRIEAAERLSFRMQLVQHGLVYRDREGGGGSGE